VVQNIESAEGNRRDHGPAKGILAVVLDRIFRRTVALLDGHTVAAVLVVRREAA
jgi:hypothetical protein